MVSGALIVIVGFYTAASLWPRRYAWLAAVLLLLSPLLFYYAGEARGYSLGTLWMTSALACVVASERTPRYRTHALIGAAVFGAAAYYTHYVAVFGIAALFVCWALHTLRQRASLPGVVTACVLAGALAMPWAPVMLQQRSVRTAQDTDQQRARQDSTSLTFGTKALNDMSAPQRARFIGEDVAGVAGAYAGLLRDHPNPPKRTIIVALLAMPLLVAIVLGVAAGTRGNWVAGACAAVVVANVAGIAALGLEGRRYLLFCVPFLILLMVFGVVELERSRMGWRAAGLLAGALVLLNLAGTVRVLRNSASQPLNGLTSVVSEGAAPRDVVVFSNAYAQIPFDYYAHRRGLKAQEEGFPVTIRAWWGDQPFKGWGGPVATHEQVREFAAGARQRAGGAALWLVLFENEIFDPKNALRSALLEGARSVTDVGNCGRAPAAVCGLSEWHVYRIVY